jgi:hypothetical protein
MPVPATQCSTGTGPGRVGDVVAEGLTDQEVLLVRYQDHVGAATPTQGDALVAV